VTVGAACAEGPAPRLVPGEVMPRITGEFLTGGDAVLPDAAGGRVALLALGFSYDSRQPVEAWVKRFRQIYPTGDQLTFFEVPMLGRGARLARWFIDRGMRRGTAPDLHEHVVTVYGGTGPWKERLGVVDEDLAYLVLLDREGRIRWLHAGMFDESQLMDLRTAIDGLLDGPLLDGPGK
jgi:hypothetical protein